MTDSTRIAPDGGLAGIIGTAANYCDAHAADTVVSADSLRSAFADLGKWMRQKAALSSAPVQPTREWIPVGAETVSDMLARDGLYAVGDTREPDALVPIVVRNGDAYAVKLEPIPLCKWGWLETVAIYGGFTRYRESPKFNGRVETTQGSDEPQTHVLRSAHPNAATPSKVGNGPSQEGADGSAAQQTAQPSCEQQARDMLERMEVPDAQSYSAGELVELANLIARTYPIQQTAQPVAWMYTHAERRPCPSLERWAYKGDWTETPLYAAQPPREPTPEMIKCGLQAMMTNNVRDSSEQGRIRRIWQAMYDRADASQAQPSAPKSEP